MTAIFDSPRHDRPVHPGAGRARAVPRARPLHHGAPGRVRVLEFGVGFPPRARTLGRGGVSADDTAAYRRARTRPPSLRRAPTRRPTRRSSRRRRTRRAPTTPSTGCPSAASSSSRTRTAATASTRARSAAPGCPIKLVILVAGVFMNLLLALAIFTAIAWFATPTIGLKFESVEAGSPAAAAGLVAGDAIVSVDGQRLRLLRVVRRRVADRGPAGPCRADRHPGDPAGGRHPGGCPGHAPHPGRARRRQGRPGHQGRRPGLRVRVPRRVHRPSAGPGRQHRVERDHALVRPDPRRPGQPRGLRRVQSDRRRRPSRVPSASRPHWARPSGAAAWSWCSTSPASCRPTWRS